MNRDSEAEKQGNRRARLEAELQEIDAEIAVLQTRRRTVRGALAGMKGAEASANVRRTRAALRDPKIVARALEMKQRSYLPIGWLQLLAEEFELSARQVARVLHRESVVVAPYRRRS